MKINNFFLVCFLSINSVDLKSSMPEPYSELKEVLPFNDHGWYGNAEFIEKLMTLNKVKIVVEVGSWLGKSTRHIASLLQPEGKLYAIDTWKGSVEHINSGGEIAEILPVLYEQFLSNIIHSNLINIVIPVRMTSLQAAPLLIQNLGRADLVYIDAAHDAKSVMADLKAYWPLVANKGILCGDDWTWNGVVLAVKKFAMYHGLTVYHGGNFWFLKRENGYSEKNLNSSSIESFRFNLLQ